MKRNLLILMVCMVCGAILTACVATGLSGLQRSLSTTTWGYQITKAPHPVFLGAKSQRFEVRAGDCAENSGWSDCKSDRERSEVIAESARFSPGADTWISFLIYLPEDFQTSNFVNVTLGQIHMQGGGAGSAGGFRSFPPLLQLNAKATEYTACFHMLFGNEGDIKDYCDERKIADIAAMKGKWNRVTLHLKAGLETPRADVFFNGKQVANFEQKLPHDPEYYYLKYGIYRSFVSKHGAPMPTQVVYYDEVKVGSTQADVENELEVID